MFSLLFDKNQVIVLVIWEVKTRLRKTRSQEERMRRGEGLRYTKRYHAAESLMAISRGREHQTRIGGVNRAVMEHRKLRRVGDVGAKVVVLVADSPTADRAQCETLLPSHSLHNPK